MSKNRDLLIILLIVTFGMFIPFIVSITLVYGFQFSSILITFGYFIIVFGIELGIVYGYFSVTNYLALKKLDKLKPK
jgi:hypothetical protein